MTYTIVAGLTGDIKEPPITLEVDTSRVTRAGGSFSSLANT